MTPFRVTHMVAAGAVLVAAVSLQAQSDTAADARAFVEEMAKAGMAEVMLGRIAVQRASDAEVKSFAQRMIDEHAAANEELMLRAGQLNVSMPTVPGPTSGSGTSSMRMSFCP